MKRNIVLLLILAGLFFSNGLIGQQSPQDKGLEVITMNAIKAQLEFLASDWTEGRETGTRGIFLAGDYVASMFKFSGVPGGGDMVRSMGRRLMMRSGEIPQPERSYFQNFTLLETLPGGESTLSVVRDDRTYMFQENIDFTLQASSTANISGELVFVGYGIQNDELGINELSGADLRGKIAVRLSGLPGMGDENSPVAKKLMEDRMAAYRLMRGIDRKLKEMGALAVIQVSTANSPVNMPGEYVDDMDMSPNESTRNTEFTRLRLDDEDLSPEMITVSAGPKLVKAIMKDSGIDIEKYAKDAANELGKTRPVEIKGTRLNISAEVRKRRVRVRNVIAMIEGKNKDEFVVIGAHMDHMGMSGGRIWNGADDNASGTVGVMTIAQAFAATGVQPERTVIFCAWTGEEKGLLGSEYFTRNPVFSSMDHCKFYINFDMIARDAEKDEEGINVGVTYNSKYPEILDMCKRNVTDYELKMNFEYRGQEDPTGGSDYTAFTENGVPVIAFMAAMHPDYHTPNDETEYVNWGKMLDIIKLGFLNLWEVANKE
ncbi:MAG TPA: M20/M25/M40 family metallo-hydrolase [Bacteroidetes bacterium]|nr:M20/M25/M40 family metallo-hydrolase [Bacteroidota bacterium]